MTPAGAFAFYPEGSQAGVDMAKSIGGPANLTTWAPQGRVITAPPMAGTYVSRAALMVAKLPALRGPPQDPTFATLYAHLSGRAAGSSALAATTSRKARISVFSKSVCFPDCVCVVCVHPLHHFILAQASDDTLTSFTFVGPMFTTNKTYGQMNADIVWVNTSVQVSAGWHARAHGRAIR